MPLHIPRNAVTEHYMPEPTSNPGGGAKTSKGAAGNECSMSVVTRVPDYHTLPHRHDSEQINYISDGEIWFFVEEKAYRCRAGDFQRIPRNVVHWAWNRADNVATIVETHTPGGSDPVDPNTPPRIEGPYALRPNRGLFDEGETPRLRLGEPKKESRIPYDQEIAEDSEPLTSGLYVAAESLPLVKGRGQAELRGVYGTESSLSTVAWPAGHHSSPYVHDAEALIHFLDGEIWFFIEDKGFKCEAGDFLRVPRNAIHWEWNASNHPVRALVEYSPPVLDVETLRLQGGTTPEGWVALFDEAETPRMYGNARTYGVAYEASRTETSFGLK